MRAYQSERFTRDLDALAADISKDELQYLVSEAIKQDLNDGLFYGDVEVEDLVDQGQYGGCRFKLPFQIGALPLDSHKMTKLSRIHL